VTAKNSLTAIAFKLIKHWERMKMPSFNSVWTGFALGILIYTSPLLGSYSVAAQTRVAPSVASLCAPCHGLDGIGHDVEIPNIAGQHSVYLRNQLMAFKKGQRKHPEMRYIARELSEREIDELVVYYSALPPL
jgi:cytochrome c553